MNKVPNRKKLRREYLTKKSLLVLWLLWAVFYMSIGMMTILTHGIAYAAVLSILGVNALLALFVAYRHPSLRPLSLPTVYRRLKELPYVPPVTADVLPAEEVLVRGAEAPAATSETLLRATTATQETKAEELLRVTQE